MLEHCEDKGQNDTASWTGNTIVIVIMLNRLVFDYVHFFSRLYSYILTVIVLPTRLYLQCNFLTPDRKSQWRHVTVCNWSAALCTV